MLKKLFFLYCLFLGLAATAQLRSKEFRSKKFLVVKDTIQIDSVSINSQNFMVFNEALDTIAASAYQINFLTAQLIINSKQHKWIRVDYFRFPDFLTKTYSKFDESIILPNTANTEKLYSLTTNISTEKRVFFNELETKGNITRGVTIGNNQNTVANSSLDLTIEGNLSKEVRIKANIFDTNIPLQADGYSQKITDFDRIFIEFEHKKWRLKAGDLDLKNDRSYFMPFTKKVSGLSVTGKPSDNFEALASGALVRGTFATYKFIGQEGNQGPYKVIGENNETALLIVGGSDILYLNGRPLQRGDDKDYTIDYTNSEIKFNTTLPIANDMRFHLEYQYSDSKFARFITYEAANYKTDTWEINGFFYNENDAKNQPNQQNFTDIQKEILANAGNDTSKMIASSAFEDAYNESRILYKKETSGTSEFFEYSTDPTATLYTVTFTYVGPNKGSYLLDRNIAIGAIHTYAGVNLGDYEPIVRLTAPSKTQIAAFNARFKTKKTSVFGELAFSTNDANLFSSIDDAQNKDAAARLQWEQLIIDTDWKLSTEATYEYTGRHFKTPQRFQSVEFNRDWNSVDANGHRNLFTLLLHLRKQKKSSYSYGINHMNYGSSYSGTKHDFTSATRLKKTVIKTNTSYLKSTNLLETNSFLRVKGSFQHSLNNAWIGGHIDAETNKKQLKITQDFSDISHQFREYETYIGLGDSTKVHAKIGYNHRKNDSIRNNRFTTINSRNTFYISSKLVENKKTSLSLFANYRTTNNAFSDNETALNSRITYRQKLFNNFINLQSMYETSSGNVPRQEYIYIETEPGQGLYTWIDYNNNDIKEFNEFEIAIYKDQANYLRLALPNLNFIRTQRAKLAQVFTVNPSQWGLKKGFRKIISRFYNQTNFSINNELERNNNGFHWNPLLTNTPQLLGLNFSARNSLFLNRGLNKYSFIFTYAASKNKQLYLIGSQEFITKLHQLEFKHNLSKFWRFEGLSSLSKEDVNTENFSNQNYQIDAFNISPQFTYEYSKNHQFSFLYSFKNKQNLIASKETLAQQKLGTTFYYKSKKNTLVRAELNLLYNDFTGGNNSPVSYQMLEGLQAGQNATWSLLLQKKINSFINLHVNYIGRKSENASAIHTGSVQLRANF